MLLLQLTYERRAESLASILFFHVNPEDMSEVGIAPLLAGPINNERLNGSVRFNYAAAALPICVTKLHSLKFTSGRREQSQLRIAVKVDGCARIHIGWSTLSASRHCAERTRQDAYPSRWDRLTP